MWNEEHLIQHCQTKNNQNVTHPVFT